MVGIKELHHKMDKSMPKSLKDGIRKIYSRESGIPLDDPDFWNKLSEWKAEQYGECAESLERVCPCCGRSYWD